MVYDVWVVFGLIIFFLFVDKLYIIFLLFNFLKFFKVKILSGDKYILFFVVLRCWIVL